MQIDLIKVGQRGIRILPWIFCLFLALMLFQECESNSVLTNNLIREKTNTTYYKNELGSVTASNEVLEYEKKQLEQLVINKIDSLKKLTSEFSKVKAIIRYKTRLKIDSIPVPFEIKVPCDFARRGEFKSEWFYLGYQVNEMGIIIKPFETWTNVTSITGFKKKWFWGKQTYTTDITPSNPHIQIQNIKSYEEKVPVKWYESTLFKVTVGFVAGFTIAK